MDQKENDHAHAMFEVDCVMKSAKQKQGQRTSERHGYSPKREKREHRNTL